MARRITQAKIERIRRLCEVHSMTAVAGIVGISRHTIGDLKRRGWKVAEQPRRPRPSDFAILCETMTKKELMRRYRAGDRQVQRWSEEVSRPRKVASSARPSMPIPADLAAVVAQLGSYGAAEHYGVSYGTVKRWRKVQGLPVSWSRRPKSERPAPSMVGWADTYFADRRSA